MAKRTGLGDRLYFGGYDLSGDVGSVQTLRASRTPLDVTGIDKDAVERILGLADGEIGFASWWNDAGSYTALRALPTTDIVTSYYAGTAIGNGAASVVGKYADLSVSRGQDGSLALGAQVLGSGAPLEWGLQLTNGVQTFASSGTATKVDNTTSTTYGGAAYLHLTGISSGTATVKVQHSSDDSTYTDLITFTAASAITSERAATAAVTTTVNRYVRVNVTGTFTNAIVAVNFVRYPTSQT